MKKFVLVPDSFKGTMTSAQVCASMEAGIRRVLPQAQVVSLPVADGGEGSAEAFLTALGGQRVVRAGPGAGGPPQAGLYCRPVPAASGLSMERGKPSSPWAEPWLRSPPWM